jgi:hypothetical protein
MAELDYIKIMQTLSERMTAAKETESTVEIRKFLKDKHPYVRYSVTKNPYLNFFHLDMALEDSDLIVRIAVLEHPNIKPYHIEKALKDESFAVRQRVKVKFIN